MWFLIIIAVILCFTPIGPLIYIFVGGWLIAQVIKVIFGAGSGGGKVR